MKSFFRKAISVTDSREDFHLGATITMIVLILAFVGTSFYFIVSNY